MALAQPASKGSKEAILDATDVLMARFGFRKMTMDDVAKAAGVSKRTIYLHFRSKEDVGLSSIDRVVQGVHCSMQEIANSPAPIQIRLQRTLVERVMGRLLAVRDYRLSLDELFEAVRPAYLVKRQGYFTLEAALIEQLIQEGSGQGVFVGHPRSTAESMILATNAFLPYSLSVEELGEFEAIRSRLEAMVALLIKGITKNETERGIRG